MKLQQLIDTHKNLCDIYQKELIAPLNDTPIQVITRDLWNKIQRLQNEQ
jgi:hypothetical protein